MHFYSHYWHQLKFKIGEIQIESCFIPLDRDQFLANCHRVTILYFCTVLNVFSFYLVQRFKNAVICVPVGFMSPVYGTGPHCATRCTSVGQALCLCPKEVSGYAFITSWYLNKAFD